MRTLIRRAGSVVAFIALLCLSVAAGTTHTATTTTSTATTATPTTSATTTTSTTTTTLAPATTTTTTRKPVVVKPATVRPATTAKAPATCATVEAVVNAHGLYLPSTYRLICPGRALVGAPNGNGSMSAYCPCRSVSGATSIGDGPEGAGPYVSIAHVTPYVMGYEFCNAILGVDKSGNSHDTESGGTLSGTTAQCVASHGLTEATST
jgi:hypothetical protein